MLKIKILNKKMIIFGVIVCIIMCFLAYHYYFPVVGPITMWQAENNLALEQERLLDAINLWNRNSNLRYQMDIALVIGAPHDLMCPLFQAIYQDGQVVSSSPTDISDKYCNGFISRMTMDTLFNQIKEDLVAGPKNIYTVVEYDPQLGYIKYYKRIDVDCVRRLGGTGGACYKRYQFSNLTFLETQP